MPKAPTSKSKPSKGGYYAVVSGYTPGIYTTWDDAERQVKGFPKPVHKKFKTLHEAEAFIAARGVSTGASTSSQTRQTLVAFPVSTGPTGASVRVPAPVNSSKKGKEKARTDQRASPFEDVPVEEEHMWEVIYTDGACSNNGKGAHLALAGVGVWYGHGDPRNISERCPGDQTNNRAELIAIIRALEEIPPSETETENDNAKPLLIKTDSKYSIQSVYSWVPNFMHKAQLAEQAANRALEAARTPSEISKAQRALDAAKVWKTSDGKNVKNQALLHYLVTLLQYRKRVLKQEWRLQHVKGHSGEVGNEGADGLAVSGARMGWVEEDDWDSKREGLQDQIDGTFLAWGDRDKDNAREKEVGLEDTDNLPSDAEVNADSDSDADADEWDFDEDMLDAIDPPSPVKKEAIAIPGSSANARSVEGVEDVEDEDEDPFADLTEEQLAALESPARPSGPA